VRWSVAAFAQARKLFQVSTQRTNIVEDIAPAAEETPKGRVGSRIQKGILHTLPAFSRIMSR
jgi:hypothetical protein